jgi:indole-3-acetate monooxygenase
MTAKADALLAEVERIAPLIREHADTAERDRRPAGPVIDAMRAAGLFRLLLPASLGGAEMDPVGFAQVVEALARNDTAAAWVMQAASISDWWGARFPRGGRRRGLRRPGPAHRRGLSPADRRPGRRGGVQADGPTAARQQHPRRAVALCDGDRR